MTKLLILSSNTGEGHNSAAAAIRAAADAAGLEASIRKPLEESGRVNRMLGNFYNTLLTRKPQWMTRYLWLVNHLRPNEREGFYSSQKRFIGRFIDSAKPDTILSVHPMLNHFIQRFVKDEKLGIPCLTFLTDPFPPFWKGWASPYVDRYFVAREEAENALIGMNVPKSRIERVPMPVRPQFVPASPADIRKFRDQLGLDNGSIILLNGGARGGGPLFRIYQSIQRANVASNIVVICGRNPGVRRQIEAEKDPRTRVFGFVDEIHRFIAAADLVLTKPGAMSSYEAMACNVPPVLLGILALMPQESGMFEAATRYGFGYSAASFEDLDRIIREGPIQWRRKRAALSNFYQPSHGEELVERIHPAHARA